jgi:multidrug resistance efflux pump
MNATEVVAPPVCSTGRPPKRELKRSTRIGIMIVTAMVTLQVLGFGGTYLLFSRHYVSTDNAQVDGDRVDINAPTSGLLTDWTVGQGSRVRPNQVLGHVRHVGAGLQPEQTIRSEGSGTVAVRTVVEGQYVVGGQTLATAYDFDTLYVTARVNETEIGDVHPGRLVDIKVDAFPDTPVSGIVAQIQDAAAGEFTIYPASNEDPTNPQKIDQYVPVRIALTVTNGLALVPGMNVTVHIHKT